MLDWKEVRYWILTYEIIVRKAEQLIENFDKKKNRFAYMFFFITDIYNAKNKDF